MCKQNFTVVAAQDGAEYLKFVLLFVGLFVCQKDYRKTTSTIFMKLGRRV